MINKLLFITFISVVLCSTFEAVASDDYEMTNVTNVTQVNMINQNFDSCASLAALQAVPDGVSHHKGHESHQSIGIGFGSCEGSTGAAIGYYKQLEDNTYKLNIGASGDVTTVGAGASFNF